jgi:hypothetical protein
MIEGLDRVMDQSGLRGLTELRCALEAVLGGSHSAGRVIDQQKLKRAVYRLNLAFNGRHTSVVVKYLDPNPARRNQLVSERWLPAIGLGGSSPRLLGLAADRSGSGVWHIYEDLGDGALDARNPDPERVRMVVDLIARLHTRSAGYPLLAECRHYGDDLGHHYFVSNVRDAIRCLQALRPPEIQLSPEHRALRDRLLERMYTLLGEAPYRAQVIEDLGGPEVLLHGDLWTTNTLHVPAEDGLQARLIDWDHAGVGPASYDLSTFLYRFPPGDRRWILDWYQQAVERVGWRLPAPRELNLLFETAECARYANRAIWPAIALLRDRHEWGFDELRQVEQWFEMLGPVLPLDGGASCDQNGAVRPLDSAEALPTLSD